VTNEPTPTAGTPEDTASVDELLAAENGGAEEGASAQDGVVGDELLSAGQEKLPVAEEVVIDDATMRRALEAVLMVTDEPLPVLTLARAVGRTTADVASALAALAEEYTEQERGFDLREVGGGWRYYTRVELAPYVERFVLDGQQARLTQAALETLAVVAYKQPVSRARVSAIRGVNVDGVMRTLVARGLVEEAGSDTESQAILYRTTSYFLERMGMHSLDDLPELAPYLPEMDDIEEELAAQSLPPASDTTEDASTPSPDDSPEDEAATPSSDETTPEDEAGTPSSDETTADDEAGMPPSDESTPDDEAGASTSDESLPEHEAGTPTSENHGSQGGQDSAGDDGGADGDLGSGDGGSEEEPDAGIDGDLGSGELEVEHEAGELEVSEEVEPAGDTAAESAGKTAGETAAGESAEGPGEGGGARDGG